MYRLSESLLSSRLYRTDTQDVKNITGVDVIFYVFFFILYTPYVENVFESAALF